MGKINGRLHKAESSKWTADRIDRWFGRASHTSQVLLLLLGVFGYFYTVLPIYQKSLLDEDIAQKTLEIREQEKRVAALNAEIRRKQSELIERDQQVTAARSIAINAKNETRSTYVKLRMEYVSAAVVQLRNCTSPFHNREPDGAELSKCPPDVLQRVDYQFSDLKREDVQLFTSILRKKVAELDPQFQKIVSEYRAKLDATQSERQNLDKQWADIKAAGVASGPKPAGYFKQSTDLIIKLSEAEFAPTKLRNEAYSQYRKMLERAGDEVSRSFYEKASP